MTQQADPTETAVKKPRKKKGSKTGRRNRARRDTGMLRLPWSAIAVALALAVGVGIGRVLTVRS